MVPPQAVPQKSRSHSPNSVYLDIEPAFSCSAATCIAQSHTSFSAWHHCPVSRCEACHPPAFPEQARGTSEACISVSLLRQKALTPTTWNWQRKEQTSPGGRLVAGREHTCLSRGCCAAHLGTETATQKLLSSGHQC